MRFLENKAVATGVTALSTFLVGYSVGVGANPVVDEVKGKLADQVENFSEEGVRSILGEVFDTVEAKIEVGDGKPEFELGALKAYDDLSPNSFLFNQIGVNSYDHRTTLNLGLGYRMLNDEQTWMGGVNAFYDHEFPNDHQRTGVGIEMISSAVKLRGNLYNGISDFKTDRSGTDSKALDGRDIDLEVVLPYLPGASIAYNNFLWEGVDGASDLKGKKYSLAGNLSDNVSIDFSRTDYDEVTKDDINRVQLTYEWKFGEKNSAPKIFDIGDRAYSFSKLEDEKYALVKRENRIAKQKKFSATASGF